MCQTVPFLLEFGLRVDRGNIRVMSHIFYTFFLHRLCWPYFCARCDSVWYLPFCSFWRERGANRFSFSCALWPRSKGAGNEFMTTVSSWVTFVFENASKSCKSLRSASTSVGRIFCDTFVRFSPSSCDPQNSAGRSAQAGFRTRTNLETKTHSTQTSVAVSHMR